jgi:serine protease AprX
MHVLSLRVPGSYVDTYYPGGVVGTRFQAASGTSQSTAVVSGVVALLRQQFPQANPDQIKALLRKGAFKINADAYHAGTGIVSANGAALLGSSPTIYNALPTTSSAVPGTGTGTLEGSRGDSHVIDGTVELRGEQDIFGRAFGTASMATLEGKATSWTGGTWNGSVWTSATGSATAGWSAVAWSGKDWAGTLWSGSRWKNMAWDGSRWKGTGWAGSRWRNASWSDAMWSGSRWR